MVKSRRFTKSLGTFGKMISIIPDTTELIGKAMDNTRPIVEKHMEQRQQKQENLRIIDDVINLSVDDAKAHLEKIGFVVATIPAKPNKIWLSNSLNEVVSMSPRGGKRELGSLVKLYYINLDVLEKSQELRDQDTLRTVEFNQKVADAFDTVKHLKIPFIKK
ncbi:PASTA domain-containing protein [Streptococcus iniae]|uniref:PASTA domain-containing protein n=1 Tax=Streptococcus iniae TaxID=1346 RepID=A0A3L8GIX8_STRIN|nr:PASTA domain-containing protein [Streptococcus iniae]AGM98801.1 hypothetical protein K710_1029 [Streptococcus iniae SF1]AHY15764.1 hypothetical protein DQ08_04690 [Streptococcus iniae]AHY17631.1 hypothetical protein DW64_04685 [Streptococcus iniae]AJG25928.1 hypothetical protein SI82_04890 [Streptococcus iniae]APD31803.1 hypothetical protein BMF34_04780 [Streptococcus iniae]